LRYIVSDYEDSFSDSGKDTAYIAFSSKKTYRQVLATLHTLWGDYTDYGYVYAMANVIAEQLGWQTDSQIDIAPAVAKEFFLNNPKAIDLQYPCFSSEFASEETVSQCKALSTHLFDDIKWVTALEKPIDIQSDEYYELVEAYAREVGISFARQTCGYAYRGEYLPLCINTTYAQLIVDRNYSDYSSVIYGDYFSDYESIYQTANITSSNNLIYGDGWVATQGYDPNEGKTTNTTNANTKPTVPEDIQNNNPVDIPKYTKRTSDKVKIEVIKDSISNKSVKILITDNNEIPYGWGEYYTIQKKVNGKWLDVEYESNDIAWIAIAYGLNENNQLTQTLHFENVYGILDSGIYRIGKCLDSITQLFAYSNEFEIK
jgi:hypothetical protein